MVRSFNDRVAEACCQSDLYRRVNDLISVASFTPFHHQALEQIDQELTKMLVSTNKTYCKSWDLPWWPKLHQAFLQHQYWTIKLSAHCTEKDMSQALAKITEQLTEPLLCGPSIAANLQQARKNLQEMQQQAAALRQEYLELLLAQAHHTNDEKWWKLILHLKCAEENWWCFALVKNFMKPQSTGISRLIVLHPGIPNKWVTLYDPRDIERALLTHCQAHFQQAHGFPFTIPPLSTLLGYDALTPFEQQVLDGNAPLADIPINQTTRLLIQHQHYATPQPHWPLCHGNAIRLHDARILKMARVYINLSFRQTFRHLQISAERYPLKQKEVSDYKQFFKPQSITAQVWWLPCHLHDPSNNWTCSDSLPHSWMLENSLELICGERYWQPSYQPFKGYSFSGGRP